MFVSHECVVSIDSWHFLFSLCTLESFFCGHLIQENESMIAMQTKGNKSFIITEPSVSNTVNKHAEIIYLIISVDHYEGILHPEKW